MNSLNKKIRRAPHLCLASANFIFQATKLSSQTACSLIVIPQVGVIIIDGAALVNMLRPGSVEKFSEYASQLF